MKLARGVVTSLTVVLTAAALAASCKGTEPSPEPAPTAAVPEPAPPAWKHMTKEQRADHMKRVVLPTMKREFAAVDAEEFADFKCATCHGDGAKDKTFKMPNPLLPKLPGDPEGFRKLMDDEPVMTAFMKNTVVPKMAAMLGEAPYDPATHQGFGCFRCHTKQ